MKVKEKRIGVDDFRSMPDIVDPLPGAHLLGIRDGEEVFGNGFTGHSKP